MEGTLKLAISYCYKPATTCRLPRFSLIHCHQDRGVAITSPNAINEADGAPNFRKSLASVLQLLFGRGGALGLLSHKLSDCRHQTEVRDRFFKKSLGTRVAAAPLVGKSVESG